MSRKQKLLFPFCADTGRMLGYTGSVPMGQEGKGIVWKEAFVFEDTLVYQGYGGGRSAMSMTMKSASTGLEYYLFWRTFDALLRGHAVVSGGNGQPLAFTRQWTFAKYGQSYGLILAREESK